MQLAELVSYLDGYLDVRSVPDAPHALNGLLVERSGAVTRLAAAVDLCDATIGLAAAAGANFLLVHHGLFWGGVQPLVGAQYRRVARLIRHDIALYSAHLPLDRHPEVGNNAVLARALAVAPRGEFGEEYGKPIGVWGELAVGRAALAEGVRALLAAAELLAMAPWFSASAVAPTLVRVWRLAGTSAAWLTISVQLGFVVGAVTSAALTLADVWSARRLVAWAAALAGLATL